MKESDKSAAAERRSRENKDAAQVTEQSSRTPEPETALSKLKGTAASAQDAGKKQRLP
ncbi:MAG: hypothetical protein ABI859_04050 [Pseudomonadota bacterium]